MSDPRVIFSVADGVLYCPEDKTNWCEHIAQCIDDRSDYDRFFANLDPTSSLKIQVPIVPSIGIFDTLYLDQEIKPGIRPVLNETGDTLALLCKGEGMKVLRSILVNVSHSHPPVVRCESSIHEYGMDKVFDKMTDAQKAGNVYLLNTQRICIFCWARTQVSTDDLIPEV